MLYQTPIIAKNYPSEILTSRMYLGDQFHAQDYDVMTQLGVTHILNCTDMLPNFFEDSKRIDLEYMRVNIEDEADVKIDLAFPSAWDFIDDAIMSAGSSPLMRREGFRFKKNTLSLIDRTTYKAVEDSKHTRLRNDLQVYSMDGQEVDFKTSKKAPKTKMTNLTAYRIESQLAELEKTLSPHNHNVVFIHCAMGRSRSATCVIMYLMKKFDVSFANVSDKTTSITIL